MENGMSTSQVIHKTKKMKCPTIHRKESLKKIKIQGYCSQRKQCKSFVCAAVMYLLNYDHGDSSSGRDLGCLSSVTVCGNCTTPATLHMLCVVVAA